MSAILSIHFNCQKAQGRKYLGKFGLASLSYCNESNQSASRELFNRVKIAKSIHILYQQRSYIFLPRTITLSIQSVYHLVRVWVLECTCKGGQVWKTNWIAVIARISKLKYPQHFRMIYHSSSLVKFFFLRSMKLHFLLNLNMGLAKHHSICTF